MLHYVKNKNKFFSIMQRFKHVFKSNYSSIIGMIHVDPLPGTPKYSGNFEQIIEKAKYESNIYKKHKIDSILIENMNDVPYVQDCNIGPEIIAAMTRITYEVRQLFPSNFPIGLQILACGNKQAMAVAKVTNCQYIRVEGFVFSHIADEGFTNANAGDLLRYRRMIQSDNVLVLTDIKKKHSSHTITKDVSLLDTAKAAKFFLTDGLILTGSSTGHEANPTELYELYNNKLRIPLLIGSGVTDKNISKFFYKSNGLIIGSHFKNHGSWENGLCENRIQNFMNTVNDLKGNFN